MPYRQSRRSTRQMTVSGDSTISYSSRRTFSFGGGMSQIKYSRRLPRQMTVSGDSGYSSRPYRSVTKLFGRALSTTLTLNSMDGSNSTILLEDWRLKHIHFLQTHIDLYFNLEFRPIFDKFDREVDGKQVIKKVKKECSLNSVYTPRMVRFRSRSSLRSWNRIRCGKILSLKH